MSVTFVGAGGETRLAGTVTGIYAGRALTFAFDTPGLENGLPIYLPSIGDTLRDAWISVPTAFDGASPLCDIGTFVGSDSGLYAAAGGIPPALDSPDTEPAGAGYAVPANRSLTAWGDAVTPGLFVASVPMLVVVSQDGRRGGPPIGGTTGIATVFIIVATPTALTR